MQNMNDRQRSILRLLGSAGELSVTSLSDKFGVSGATIRQDLDYLQNQSLVRRVHGGVVLNSDDDISHRIGINYEEKSRIAERASSYIRDGETIFIEAGSANALLARYLSSRPAVKVVTSNLFIARTLKESSVNVIMLGGVYQHDSECVVGTLARVGLEELNFSKAFIGVDGFSPESGFTCSDMMRAEIARAAVMRCRQAFVLTDSTKFGKIALTKICDPSQISQLITDSDIPQADRDYLADQGVNLDVVDI